MMWFCSSYRSLRVCSRKDGISGQRTLQDCFPQKGALDDQCEDEGRHEAQTSGSWLCEKVGWFTELLIFPPKKVSQYGHSRRFFVVEHFWMKNLDVTHR